MEQSGRIRIRCCLLLLCVFSGGCVVFSSGQTGPRDSRPAQAASFATPAGNPQTAAIRRVPFSLRAADPTPTGPSAPDSALAGTPVLSVETLVKDVLARNPSLAQMTAAWQAASARYPQVTSLEDPMLGTKLGPGSFGSNTVDFAYMV